MYFIFKESNRTKCAFVVFKTYGENFDLIPKMKKEIKVIILQVFPQAIKFLFSEILQEFISENISWIANDLSCDIIKPNVDVYVDSNSQDLIRMVRLEYLIRISKTKLPIEDIKVLFEGKNALDDFSQAIMKNNISRFLSSYQFDRNDKKRVCSILKFNIKDVLIEEQKFKEISQKN